MKMFHRLKKSSAIAGEISPQAGVFLATERFRIGFGLVFFSKRYRVLGLTFRDL